MLIPKRKLIRVALKCLKCDEIVEATQAHDRKKCFCGSVLVSGGPDKPKMHIAGFPSKVEDLCEYGQRFCEPNNNSDDDLDMVDWLREHGYPENGNWSKDQEVFYKLRWD